MKVRLKSRLEGLPHTLSFLTIIFFIGLWIAAFLLLKDHLFSAHFAGIALTDLTCAFFFGGLVAALISGALIGNFLRRRFWKFLK
jgi:hypothetical protein